MIRINLLPVREKKKQESTRNMLGVLVISLAGVAVILYFFHLSLSRQIERVNDKIQEYNSEIARLRLETRDVNKFKAEKEDLQRRLNIIQALQQAKMGPVRVLDELSMALPGKLWLVSLREKEGKMEIKGLAMDNPTIAQFMTNLEKTGVIKNVELVVSQQMEKNEIKLKEFTLMCQVLYSMQPMPTQPAGSPPSNPQPPNSAQPNTLPATKSPS